MTAVDTAKGISTVLLPERFDSVTAESVERMLRGAIAPGAKVIVDGSAVTYMSAAGVRTLASTLHAAQLVDAHFVFCRFTGPAADCLEVSGFAQLLEVAGSLDEARARFDSRAGQWYVERLRARGATG